MLEQSGSVEIITPRRMGPRTYQLTDAGLMNGDASRSRRLPKDAQRYIRELVSVVALDDVFPARIGDLRRVPGHEGEQRLLAAALVTLIVGIRCSGGVVIGSDSAITFAAGPQTLTIQQRSSAKIEVIDDSLIVAGTGALGMGQRFTDITRQLSQSQQHKTAKSLDIGRTLSAAASQDFANTGAPASSYGALVAGESRVQVARSLSSSASTDFNPR